jgi:hypothetical protein
VKNYVGAVTLEGRVEKAAFVADVHEAIRYVEKLLPDLVAAHPDARIGGIMSPRDWQMVGMMPNDKQPELTVFVYSEPGSVDEGVACPDLDACFVVAHKEASRYERPRIDIDYRPWRPPLVSRGSRKKKKAKKKATARRSR